MRELLRFKMNAMFLVISFCIASAMYNYSGGVEGSVNAEETDRRLYEFTYGASVSVGGAAEAGDNRKQAKEDMLACIEGIAEEENTLIFLSVFNVYVNDAHTGCTAEIYMSGPMPKYSFVKGGFPTEEQLSSGMRYVVLGDGMKHNTYRRSGKDYILIQGDEYEVTGYVSAPNSGILSNTILLFYNAMGSNIIDTLCEYYIGDPFIVQYMSDTNQAAYTHMMDYLHTLVPASKSESEYVLESDVYKFIVSDGAEKHDYSSNAEQTLRYQSFAKLIFVFCIIVIMFVLWLWMVQRQEEFAIRKAFGYSAFKLWVMVFIEIAELILVAAVLSELVIAVIAFVDKDMYVFKIGDVYSRFFREVSFIYICLIIVSILSFINLCIKKPVVLMNKGKK